jgi:nucleotide-binding universal stress UspA family protein
MRKILIGVHDKYCSMRAVEYMGKQFSLSDGPEVLLVHVLPNLPAIFWDEGHILTEAEKQDRQKVVDTWVAKQRDMIEPILQSMVRHLVQSGLRQEQVKMKFISGSTDVADSLLDEAKAGGYQTILLGRCGIQEGKHLLVGSIPSKLIQNSAGLAVCIVQ